MNGRAACPQAAASPVGPPRPTHVRCKRTVVLNVVGLTESLLGPATPQLEAFRLAGSQARIVPAFPAVTCTAQANYLTGLPPARHGIVGNGWYQRDLAEVHFWKQSNRLVQGRKLWEDLRSVDPSFTCAKLFWWFNIYSSADYTITPRPIYPADGRKIFDIYTWPYAIRPEIKRDLGEFPFPTFWGPAAGRDSPQGSAEAASRWIAEAAKWIETKHTPTLSLVYLPHLDYNLQRLGPASPPRWSAAGHARPAGLTTRAPEGACRSSTQTPGGKPLVQEGEHGPVPKDGSGLNPAIVPDLRAIDTLVGELIAFFRQRSVQVVVLSEYGIASVNTPIHLNRLFRQQGWLTVKDELGLELLDAGASRLFAVADHQVAHVYLNDPTLDRAARELIERQPGVAHVLDADGKAAARLEHPRAGDLVAVAQENAWFTYYYWLDDARAPDFARTVDIHRKPGYDPVELFLDPAKPLVKLRILGRLLQKKLGFRMLMDVIPLDASLVKGSHGARPADLANWPVLWVDGPGSLTAATLDSTAVYATLRRLIAG